MFFSSSENHSYPPVHDSSCSNHQDPVPHFPNLASPNRNIPDVTDFDVITNLFLLIKNDSLKIHLPPNWSMHELEYHVIFSKLGIQNNMPYLERTVVLTEQTISAQVLNRAIDVMECVTTVEDLEKYINILNEGKICKVQSKYCHIFISAKGNECRACTKFNYRSRMQKIKYTIPKKGYRRDIYLKKRNKKLDSVIRKLKRLN